MTRREVRTPVAESGVIELGNRTWRKQCLKHGTIDVDGRSITFDKAYCDKVAEAFRRDAFDAIPFQFADPENGHNNDPNRTRGQVIGLESADDGLFATVKLSEDADALVREYPNFGVSVRIKEDYERPDGERYPAAMQHLLGCWDGRVTGMQPWQSVDLSNDPGTEVIDLTQTMKEGPVATDTDTSPVAAMQEWFQGLVNDGSITINDPAAVAAPEADGAQTDEVTADDITAMTDEQFDAWWTESGLGDIEAGDPEDEGDEPGEDDQPTEDDDQGESGQGGEVQASQTGAAVELANGDAQTVELAQANAKVIELSKRVNASEYLTERDRISRTLGIPPAWIDTVRPLLEGTDDAVQLSNGDPNPGHYVRNLLRAVGEGMKVLDLSESQGELLYPADTEEQEKAKERSERAARFAAEIG